jgi:hypothetical protein
MLTLLASKRQKDQAPRPKGEGRSAAHPPRDEARRIAANIVKLQELHLTRDEAAGAVDEALTLLRPRPLRR